MKKKLASERKRATDRAAALAKAETQRGDAEEQLKRMKKKLALAALKARDDLEASDNHYSDSLRIMKRSLKAKGAERINTERDAVKQLADPTRSSYWSKRSSGSASKTSPMITSSLSRKPWTRNARGPRAPKPSCVASWKRSSTMGHGRAS